MMLRSRAASPQGDVSTGNCEGGALNDRAPLCGSRPTEYGFRVLEPPGRSLTKYVFIQDEPFFLPRVLDKYLREYARSTVGIVVQSVSQGGRTRVQTALTLLKLFGPNYFQWKLRRYLAKRVLDVVATRIFGSRRQCHSVSAVARRYNVPVHSAADINDEKFLALLRGLGVEFILSISGTQLYRAPLRAQTPFGIVNCHGALLPKYRGLMPSFWTLANGETIGGVSVHYVDGKLDNGPIVVQRKYSIHPHDTLEEILARSKDLAAEAILDCVRLVEAGSPPLLPNPTAEMTKYSMPKREDVLRFRARGHRFF